TAQRQPTGVGLLVGGRDPRSWVPANYIQFLRIDGTELGDPVRDQKEISGRIGDIIRLLDETLEAHISVGLDISGGPVAQPEPNYPLTALQQLTRNAVLHRTYEGTNAPVRVYWYNDRVEILSPGGLFGQVRPETFGQPGV